MAKETTNKIGIRENICKQCDQKGINVQNIQTAHIAQYQKNLKKKLNKKWEDISPKKTYQWQTST